MSIRPFVLLVGELLVMPGDRLTSIKTLRASRGKSVTTLCSTLRLTAAVDVSSSAASRATRPRNRLTEDVRNTLMELFREAGITLKKHTSAADGCQGLWRGVRACQEITMPLRRGVRTRACRVESLTS